MSRYEDRNSSKSSTSKNNIELWKKIYICNIIKDEKIREKIYDLCITRPLAKIFGHKYFWKYEFKTNWHTLDPRSDTEIILEIIHKRYQINDHKSVLEIGVGTGAVIISTLLDFKNFTGVCLDISHKALKVCKYNAKKYDILHRLNIICNNWLENIDKKYDILIANPPYLRPCEYYQEIYDPKLALIEPENLYFYKKIQEKAYLFNHIIMEISTTRDITEYTNLFEQYRCVVHYNLNNQHIVLEVFTT